ncbi:MAG: 2-oxoacid:acceptor oxidoreductase subunit alpha [Planctomycetes bacterium]|nr:2-oxoacid:acceptor oxidoreductase subunit alpha [Planctomycetota bacterium]
MSSNSQQDQVSALSSSTAANVQTLPEHIFEIVSDSGEGAQKCGQSFGAVSAKMGNGAWTVEIIPAEIQPPPRSPGGASGVRIRIGTEKITNWGNKTKLVIAFNEQVLLARHRQDAIADDATILLENMWEEHDDPTIRQQWADAMEELSSKNYNIMKVPMEVECLKIVDNPRRGKNMYALGLMSWIYTRDVEKVKAQIAMQFRHKSQDVYERNVRLLEAGMKWAEENMSFQIDVPCKEVTEELVVMNGNTAIGMGAVVAGLEMCSMYPITPATSVSHYLSEIYDDLGGIVHQAEDEIAAIGVAIGASFAGKVAFTVTSGPGMALKTEFIGLAVMTETPLVIVDVQRGGPSTGLPTKVEQSDLLSTLYGMPGDAPKVVLAPSTLEECFHCMVTARRIAEAFRMVVVVLTDANLATGVQPFVRPELDAGWHAPELDLSPVAEGAKPMDWDSETGLSPRIVPGQKGGEFTATGLAHSQSSCVTYDPALNQHSSEMRSRKLAVLQSTLSPPEVCGPDSNDLLLVGWGSTRGAIEEAAEKARAKGLGVSSLNLTFLSPLEPGITEILKRFKKVMAIEINYSDDPDAPYITEENRRRGQLTTLLRATTLVDIDCWTRVLGQPLSPGDIIDVIEKKLSEETKA